MWGPSVTAYGQGETLTFAPLSSETLDAGVFRAVVVARKADGSVAPSYFSIAPPPTPVAPACAELSGEAFDACLAETQAE